MQRPAVRPVNGLEASGWPVRAVAVGCAAVTLTLTLVGRNDRAEPPPPTCSVQPGPGWRPIRAPAPVDDDAPSPPRAVRAVALTGHESAAALIDMLTDSHAVTRQAAAQALGRLGRGAAAAVPALFAAQSDRDPGVRRAATAALLKIVQDDGSGRNLVARRSRSADRTDLE